MIVSKSATPPTVRIVVTPLSSSVFAKPAHIFTPTRRVRPFEVMSFTSFFGSEGFFFGLPEAGRWTCMLMRPGIRYMPSRLTSSKPAGAPPSQMRTMRSPSMQTILPVCGVMCSVPSRSTALVMAYFFVFLNMYGSSCHCRLICGFMRGFAQIIPRRRGIRKGGFGGESAVELDCPYLRRGTFPAREKYPKARQKPMVSGGVFCILFAAVGKKYAAGGCPPKMQNRPDGCPACFYSSGSSFPVWENASYCRWSQLFSSSTPASSHEKSRFCTSSATS